MSHIRLKLGEQTISAQLLVRNVSTSPHTGKELLQLEVKFQVHSEQRPSIKEALSGKGILLSADGDSSKEVTVLLHEKQYSYTEGLPMHNQIWTLTQEEELKLDTLQVADINLHPYRFEEDIDGDALIITTRVEVDATTEQALRSLPKYFPVIRKGISDEPRTMRFGQILWSSEDEEVFTLGLTIVEQIYDEQKKAKGGGIFEPQFGHVQGALAVTIARIAKLLDTLQTKGILTEEERLEVAEVSDSERQKRAIQFDRVPDLKQWFGDDRDEE